MRLRVEFTGMQGKTPVALALAFEVDEKDPAKAREQAWDLFKQKSGLRRWVGDTPPVITPVEDAADDSSGNREPGNSAE
jgi:hypothetical protein